MVEAPRLTIERIEWTAEAEARLTVDASRRCLPHLKAEVIAGRSTLWRCVTPAGELLAVTRLDHNPTEWVMCLGVGRGLAHVAPMFFDVARQMGWPMRMHTSSPAVMRLCRRLGWELAEYVMRRAN